MVVNIDDNSKKIRCRNCGHDSIRPENILMESHTGSEFPDDLSLLCHCTECGWEVVYHYELYYSLELKEGKSASQSKIHMMPFSVTEDDILNLVEDGYSYTEEEIKYLKTRVGAMTEGIMQSFQETKFRDYFSEEIDWQLSQREGQE